MSKNFETWVVWFVHCLLDSNPSDNHLFVVWQASLERVPWFSQLVIFLDFPLDVRLVNDQRYPHLGRCETLELDLSALESLSWPTEDLKVFSYDPLRSSDKAIPAFPRTDCRRYLFWSSFQLMEGFETDSCLRQRYAERWNLMSMVCCVALE